MRTEQVVTSFESRVKRQAVVVVDKEPGEVDWDKEMVMPESDYEEAVERLRQAANALVGISAVWNPPLTSGSWRSRARRQRRSLCTNRGWRKAARPGILLWRPG